MAKYCFEMSWNYDEQEYHEFLESRNLTHLKTHNEPYFKVGDALRTRTGITARIMDKFNNYENYSHDYTLANKSLSVEQLYQAFGYQSIQGKINMQFQKDLQG